MSHILYVTVFKGRHFTWAPQVSVHNGSKLVCGALQDVRSIAV